MRKTILTMALMLLPLAAHSEGSADAGKQKAVPCATCHGEDGKSPIATYRKLAGQNAPYLVYAVKTYKANQRKGPQASLMTAIAVVLSEQDVDNLAA